MKKRHLILFLVFACVVSTTVNAQAGDLQSALASYGSGDTASAKTLLKELAHSGNAEAAYNLAKILLDSGQYSDALDWYRRAANLGSLESHYELSSLLRKGEITAKNIPAAVKLLNKAAKLGHTKAQIELGTLLVRGDGFPGDGRKGIRWLIKAAKKNSAEAQFQLGLIYKYGTQQISRNGRHALAWLERASDQKHQEATFELATLLNDGASGVRQDTDRAATYFLRAAKFGHARAQYEVSKMLAVGRAVTKDCGQAKKWASKAAAQDFEGANQLLWELRFKCLFD